MTEKELNHWIMYHEIHKLDRMGFSKAQIARYLQMDPRTVKKLLLMTEEQYEQHQLNRERKKVLTPYENFVVEKLNEYPETSTAQIHDWLKEHHDDLPEVSTRTVFNFVMYVRQKYNIPYIPIGRDYSAVPELPYGQQAQVDFGQYNMRMTNGKRKKIYFFAMVLSRSRMKYHWFSDRPFTAKMVVYAHEKAFEFFGGIPKELVYDLDRTMVVDENLGEIILTAPFREYTKSRGIELHFCRKSDPESKGKVENVIQYIKKNFLLNRTYYDIETLNEQGIAWLYRTANHLPHNYTKIPPEEAFAEERSCLKSFYPITFNDHPDMQKYIVRKTNVIAFKSNFYTLPKGTYKGPGSYVLIKPVGDQLHIYNKDEQPMQSYTISKEKGKTISNTHHMRDTSKRLNEMEDEIIKHFSDRQLISQHLENIRKKWPRYVRDHFQAMLKALSSADKQTADKVLEFCIKNHILHGNEFEQVLCVLAAEKQSIKAFNREIKLLHDHEKLDINHMPEKSNIDDYDKFINQ
ncbi:MAG: IS21 family transposase [Candidatus Cyclobacteriaceae bacterium M3_2C_046]